MGFCPLRPKRLKGADGLVLPTRQECDLLQFGHVSGYIEKHKPGIVFHLAARVGGIGANQRNPGKYFYENMQMGMNVLEASRQCGVEKVVLVGTICSYPKHTPVPFREEDLWNGYPEETNAPYGIAKKALMVMAEAYRAQYSLNTISLLPVNLYGPRDNFHLENSHVIPAMVRRCLDAVDNGDATIVLWGDGSPTREFLYVEDCAEGLVLAAERYDEAQPVNLGAGYEISMRDLAHLIAAKTGFEGDIVWDTTRPNGQPRRMLDTTRARDAFGFEAKTSLEEGLAKTVAWYKAHKHRLSHYG
ncbi:MAG: GDP-L-fucose synthase [Myxococcales bacterium]|nr:GDP-L-fucose synthase [Myxococcales bacterium]